MESAATIMNVHSVVHHAVKEPLSVVDAYRILIKVIAF